VYGSDALGGAVCFFTKDPVLADTRSFKTTGTAFLRYGSVNQEKTAHADVGFGWKKFGWLSSFTYSDFGDLRMGTRRDSVFGKRPFYVKRINGRDSLVANGDPFLQRFSGYRQYDLLQKAVWRPSYNMEHKLNVQYSTSSNIPRYDRLTDPGAGGKGLRFAEWYYGPQDRLMAAYQLQLKSAGWFNNGVHGTLAYQAIEESRYTRRFGNEYLDGRIEKVGVFSLTVEGTRLLGTHTFKIGLDAQHNEVNSVARRTQIITGALSELSTRYPDGGSRMTNMGAYLSHYWILPFNQRWIFSESLRGGASFLKAVFKDPTFFPFPFSTAEQQQPVMSGSLGAVYNGQKGGRMALHLASGFRTPNVDDLGRVFDSAPGNLIVPNPDLRPEQTYNADLTLSKTLARKVRFEITPWITLFHNAIVVAPFRLNGRDSVLFDGRLSRVAANQNARKARLWGSTFSAEADLSASIAVYGSVAYTRGRIENEGADVPLDHIPPLYGRVGGRWHTAKMVAETFVLFNGKKDIRDYNPGGEDNAQYAPADGTPAWWTWNLRLQYRFKETVTLQVGADNLLNQQYRNFASGINGPGRNLFATVRATF
jgi:hemoglobin/transferrin/lactoferrin receptor protein